MADWYEDVPKVELHLHLQGAVSHGAFFELVRKYGGDPTVPDAAALARRFAYRDFPHFIATWVWMLDWIRAYDDLAFMAEAVARDLAAQNVRYVEAFVSPTDHARHGLATGRIFEAVRRGLDRVPEVRVALVADLVRDHGPARAERTLAEVAEARGFGIVGIGIGGSEQLFPPEPFAKVYERARQLGFRTSAHAGEAAGAASVWGALRELRVDRIGHATRAEEDPALLDALREAGVPLELCPTSNLRTGVVASLDAHPVRRYFERGLAITINTDDPTMFGCTLAGEYRVLVERFGFSRDEIRGLIAAAVDASWLDAPERAALAAALRADPGWADHG